MKKLALVLAALAFATPAFADPCKSKKGLMIGDKLFCMSMEPLVADPNSNAEPTGHCVIFTKRHVVVAIEPTVKKLSECSGPGVELHSLIEAD